MFCAAKHGTVYPIDYEEKDLIPAHEFCYCSFAPMRAQKAGTISKTQNAADVYLLRYQKLPDNYVTKEEAQNAGWDSKKGNLDKVLPGKMIGGDIFENRNKKLPSSPGRYWYEADINYESGYRNNERILYSSDGLMFVSYDHYETFYEIIQ